MGLPADALEAIVEFGGWASTRALPNAGTGALEIRLLRRHLRAVGESIPQGPLPWGSLNTIAEYAVVSTQPVNGGSPVLFSKRPKP